MNEKLEIQKRLDTAIDMMDQQEIERNLACLNAMDIRSIEAEDAKAFAARIKKLEVRNQSMIKNKKSSRIILIAAAVAIMATVGVYASGVLTRFTFAHNDRYAVVQTTESMTASEAQKMAEETIDAPQTNRAECEEANSEEFEFKTIEEAEKKLDMKVVLPKKMPNLPLTPVSAQSIKSEGVETGTIWATYGDPDSKAFGITVQKTIVTGSDITIVSTSDMDEGSIGEYKSKSGVKYTMLSESDDSGERTARIATVTKGDYEYSLIFVGFSEKEMHEIIDSVDLSAY